MTSVPTACESCGCVVSDWYQHTRWHFWVSDEMDRRIREYSRERLSDSGATNEH